MITDDSPLKLSKECKLKAQKKSIKTVEFLNEQKIDCEPNAEAIANKLHRANQEVNVS